MTTVIRDTGLHTVELDERDSDPHPDDMPDWDVWCVSGDGEDVPVDYWYAVSVTAERLDEITHIRWRGDGNDAELEWSHDGGWEWSKG